MSKSTSFYPPVRDLTPPSPFPPPDQGHWKLGGLLALLAMVILGTFSYDCGRNAVPATPSQVEERVQVVEKTVYKEVFRSTTTESKKKKLLVEERTKEVQLPDGTVVKEASTTTKEDTEEKKTEVVYVDRFVDRKVESDTKTLTKTAPPPDWRVGLTAGTAPLAALSDGALTVTDLVVGLRVDRRIFGSVSAGIWADTRATGGVSVSIDF